MLLIKIIKVINDIKINIYFENLPFILLLISLIYYQYIMNILLCYYDIITKSNNI